MVAPLAQHYEDLWNGAQTPPDLQAFLNEHAAVPEATKLEVLQVDIRLRLRTTDPWPVEEYVARFPVLLGDPAFRAALAHAESQARQIAVASPAPEESVAHNSDIGNELQMKFSATRSASPADRRVDVITESYFSTWADEKRIGRYRVIRLLGQGAFGRVYLGYDDELNRQVAMKVPQPERLADPEYADDYLTEARTVAALDHPHIVPVHDVGRAEDGTPYVVSKFIEGPTLTQRIRSSRPSLEAAAELVATLAEALHHAHQRRIVHRDIKPGNILIDEQTGTAYLSDFGLAIREEDYLKDARVVGTPAYMSPEQARGEGHRLDSRSDIFALGVVLYELLTGEKPFRGSTSHEIIHQVITHEPYPPRDLVPEVPADLERICLKALSKRASDRYATAAAFADDLRHWQREPLRLPRERKIIPKGLRSFDVDDADFFLDLLPGPRDREGLPESLRFWKSRLEETDPERSFRVGLIYGPSGCGKSSLIKAGLLPQLSEELVAVYVEATPEETETRIVNRLRKSLPDLPEGRSLADTLAQLRVRASRKIVIIIDQFEQWLHAHRGERETELVRALRHCDGGKIQALLMVRDDFWLAANRFMKELEVDLLEGDNISVVDLFDVQHAERVLIKFGQAFGKLPDRIGEMSAAQRSFVSKVAWGLAQDGRIVCVRLVLFAEMIKGKPWVPATLDEVGGTKGIGVNFLEETFRSRTANPKHRVHERAARQVLRSLLPPIGTNIKGHMRSHAELQVASGYVDPREFHELLRILDGELRLVTPSDPEGADSVGNSDPRVKFYQLTHDYLVPAFRDWLTRKQKETFQGRAELKLEERAAEWNARPKNRSLPSAWELVQFSTLTSWKDWTDDQRRMMGRAGRYFAARSAVVAICVIVLLVGGWELWGRLQSQSKIATLLHAPTPQVPAVIEELAAYPRWADAPLRQRLREARDRGDERLQLHLSLALLPSDPGQLEYVLSRLLTGTAAEVAAIRDCMGSHTPATIRRLWDVLENPRADAAERLRAACFVAPHLPDDPRWEQLSDVVANRLAVESSLSLREWAEALRPIRQALLPAFANLIAQSPDAARRRRFTELYAEFAADDRGGFGPLKSILAESSGDRQAARVAMARRKAAAAAALAAAGQWDEVWPLLRDASDPTVRTYLIDRLAEGSIDTRILVVKLDPEQEPHAAARRAVLLILGALTSDDLTPADREKLLPDVSLLLDDPDPGVSAAARWVLAQWGEHNDAGPVGELAGPRMVVLSSGEIEAEDRFGERRTLRIDRTFALAARETTVAEFLRFRPHHVWDERSAQTRDCPVNEVSWFDAVAYCNWLSSQEDLPEDQWCYAPNTNGDYAAGMKIKARALDLAGYRLPTADEWEFACRAGSTTHWSFGDAVEMLDHYGWSMANSGVRSRPVGQLRPNDFGLFDMHGNVWEWCHDRVDTQGRAAIQDPTADEIVSDGFRPLRGGTFLNDPTAISSHAAIWNPPGNHTGADGFRIARTVMTAIE